MSVRIDVRRSVAASSLALLALAMTGLAPACGSEMVLYSFEKFAGGPGPVLVADGAGNLYGLARGSKEDREGGVFKLAPDGTETELYAFHGSRDGMWPRGGVILDSQGNLYGTTENGGDTGCANGCGTVFKVAPDGTETMLHAFKGGKHDGSYPLAGVILDSQGNLYGTTSEGGQVDAEDAGTVFKLAPDGTEKILHAFGGGHGDGITPYAGVVLDSQGNLYGTTLNGGIGNGTVFKVAPDGTETVLYAFQLHSKDGGKDGRWPSAGVILDSQGNLFGTTQDGGLRCYPETRALCGTVFKVAPDGTETVLYRFRGGSDGAWPYASLIMDSKGNLYGTTHIGGNDDCVQLEWAGCGTVFELTDKGKEKVLYAFTDRPDGAAPSGSLLPDGHGELLGTASGGKYGAGVVFEVTKSKK